MSKKKVVKIRTYITEKENRHIIEGIVKENSRGFENTIIVKSFFQKKKKKSQIIVQNGKRDITIQKLKR